MASPTKSSGASTRGSRTSCATRSSCRSIGAPVWSTSASAPKRPLSCRLDRFHKETKIEDNRRAIELLRDADIFIEAQFIVGLENETAQTLEETYQMAKRWNPDLANWAMYTPWPFSSLFQELGDKVEVFDFSKYNFVTPIMKPHAMDRAELLDRVMNNYRRFYMRKALFHYPWRGTGFRRRYLLGCLKAFLKAGFQRTFYDLGKVNYWGPQSKKSVDFQFDRSRKIAPAQMDDWEAARAGRAGPDGRCIVAGMPTPPSRAYSRYVLGVMFLLTALNVMDRQVLAALAEPVKAEFGLSDSIMGVLLGVPSDSRTWSRWCRRGGWRIGVAGGTSWRAGSFSGVA